MTRRLKVAKGTQVNVDGKTYAAGEALELEDGDADVLLARGTVVEEQGKPRTAKKGARGK